MYYKKILFLLVFITIYDEGFSMNTTRKKQSWKAGVARTNITPEQSMWLAVYGARDHPSKGELTDLWAKALALEDSLGHRAVLVTADILGEPKKISDAIRARLNDQLELTKAQILLNSSHTHSGPVLQNALADIYPLDEELRRKINTYSKKLVDKIVLLVEQAFNDLQPAEMYGGNGVARFQVNRWNNDDSTLEEQRDLNGPNDYAIPVLKETTAEGELKAITFGYASHPTVLDGYQWSGDYPIFAQITLEKKQRGTVAMFFQGAGADQNSLPRRTVPLRQYGRTLAVAVDRVLEEEVQKLAPSLFTTYTEVELNLNEPSSKQELAQQAESATGYQKRWAQRLLEKVKEGETPRQNELVRVSYIMAEKGIKGYSIKNLSKHNWWYNRVMKYNSFYPQYTGDKKKSFLGLSLPVGNNLTVIGQSPHVSPHNYLWPIDDNPINNNTLGTINQNKGYNGAENNKPPRDSIKTTNYK